MHRNLPLKFVCAATLLLTFSLVIPAGAQIAYVSLGANGTLQLRQMNADGAGDVPIALPFSTFLFPTWSRDGAQLAITAAEASNPPAHSLNVFTISRATGGLQRLTDFRDLFDPGNVAFSYTFPYYKAFSPERSAIAVASLTQTGGTEASGGAGVADIPILEVHSTTVQANPILVHVDKTKNGKHHGGEGVDWSPTQNLLATPMQSSSPFLSGGGPGETTAIVLVEPITTAVQQGRFRPLTFPRADGQTGTSGDAFLWGEHDYQPKFSPNGAGLVYVRSFQNFFLLRNPNPDPDIQSLRIVNVQTGADSEVIRFQPGRYVSSVDWSPDGSQLVFDLGLQVDSGVVGLLQRARPETNEIYVVNVDGSGLRKLRGPGAGTPAWSRSTAAPPAASLGNISTRGRIGTGDNALIGGFIITGNDPKRVIIRAIGPSLGSAAVQGALADPILELRNQAGALLASNDNWRTSQQAEIQASTIPPGSNAEAAIVRTLAPGSYTTIVRGKNNASGVGLVEVYDLAQSPASKLANISTRGSVETGDDVMIGGFIVGGGAGGSAKVIVRAIGPSLTPAGVANALANPTLELRDAAGSLLRSNDNWKSTQKSEIQATGVPPANDLESALLATLGAGNYTAIVRGKTNSTGVALVEVFNIP